MTRLPAPIHRVLRKTTSASAVTRMWNRIEARTRTKPRRRAKLARTIVIAAAVVGFVLAAVVLWRRPGLPAASLPARHEIVAGALALAPSQADDVERVVSLRDGSSITLAPGSAFEPLESSPSAVVLRQLRGRVLYDITPGGPRRWTIACGPVSVDVVGTSFRIDRDGSRVRVEVTRGIVLVRGEPVPDHIVRLAAGMSVEVGAEDAAKVATGASPSIAVARSAVPSSPLPPLASSAPSKSSHDASWRRFAERGENEKAYEELGPGGVARAAQSASVEQLLALADVARLSDHAREAIDPLERVVHEHSRDSRASLAAFTLGEIHLRSLASNAAAARAFEQALTLGLPEALAEDAYALWIESLSKAGDRARARAVLSEYMARFPNGARKEELLKWGGER